MAVRNVYDSQSTSLIVSTPAGDRSSSPLPEFVPNTMPEEPSYPPPTEAPKPARNLRRRVTPSVESRPPTPPKEVEPVEDALPPPRKVSRQSQSVLYHASDGPYPKLLKRRTRAATPSIVDSDTLSGPGTGADAVTSNPTSAADTSMPIMFTDDEPVSIPALSTVLILIDGSGTGPYTILSIEKTRWYHGFNAGQYSDDWKCGQPRHT